MQSPHGRAASLYDPARFIAAQAAVVGPRDDLCPNWPYSPTCLLIMSPFAALQYVCAFLTWGVTRHPAAIAPAIAWLGGNWIRQAPVPWEGMALPFLSLTPLISRALGECGHIALTRLAICAVLTCIIIRVRISAKDPPAGGFAPLSVTP